MEDRFEDYAGTRDPLALSRAVQSHYAREEAQQEFETTRAALVKSTRRALSRERKRLKRLRARLTAAEDAKSIRRRGELLKIALPEVHRGQSEVKTVDLFDPNQPTVTIELDARLTPEENLARIFKRYKKAQAAVPKLQEELQEAQSKAGELERLAQDAEAAESGEDLAALQTKANRLLPKPARTPKDGRKTSAKGPRAFTSSDGFRVLVARNERENDRLTFGIARADDEWLHVLGFAGSHVVIRSSSEGSVSSQALLDAAHLAVHFSKLRGTDFAQVTHTQRKYLRKMKGAPPGAVNYAQAKTLQFRPDPDRTARLLDTLEQTTAD